MLEIKLSYLILSYCRCKLMQMIQIKINKCTTTIYTVTIHIQRSVQYALATSCCQQSGEVLFIISREAERDY